MQPAGGLFLPLERRDDTSGPPSTSISSDHAISPVSSLNADVGSAHQTWSPAAHDFPHPLPLAQPARVLTKPAEPAIPGGHDNINDDLIVSVNDVLVSSLGTRYVVRDLLGHGTFGQVFKCTSTNPDDIGGMVAVKVIKNQAAYYHQARVEIGILQYLNTKGDPEDSKNIVRLKDFFLHKNHLCLVFELLNLNLFELVRHNKFRGLSLALVRVFLTQILEALVTLHDSNIIHCDIKPENILLIDSSSGKVKLIDFGSACFSHRTVYSYIQSRFYRSPEVVLGHRYTMSVDMWSLGCVGAELFLGLPLFPAASELDLLSRILETIGQLPKHLLQESKNTNKFYTSDFDRNGLRLKTPDEFLQSTGTRAPKGKQYFQHKALADIINAYPFRSGLNDEEIERERGYRESFTDFLLGLLDPDPLTRWTPRQALMHPFITGAAFNGPFQPEADVSVVSRPMDIKIAPPVQPGVPIGIPHPRPRVASQENTPTMDEFTVALMANSPQMHAQAHAAAMAAVQMQMSMQHGRGSGDVPLMNSYVPAHSLQRIIDHPFAASTSFNNNNNNNNNNSNSNEWRPGASFSNSFFSPPSRSFGVHLPQYLAQEQLPPPSFDPSHTSPHRIMPLLHLPTEQQQLSSFDQYAASPNFHPSSISTYRSALAAAAAATARLQRKSSSSSLQPPTIATTAIQQTTAPQHLWPATGLLKPLDLLDGTAAPTPDIEIIGAMSRGGSAGTPQKGSPATMQQEDMPNPADWDPLWSDDLLAEEEQQPVDLVGNNHGSSGKQTEADLPKKGALGSSRIDPGLVLAAQHLTQLRPLSAPGGVAATWPATITTKDGVRGGSEAMVWSPPTVCATAAMQLNAGSVGGGQREDGNKSKMRKGHQEPLQRLQGFVLSSERQQQEEDDNSTES